MTDPMETESERVARLAQEAEELGLKLVEELKPEPGDPWWGGIKRLVMSGKAWVTLLGTIGAVAMHVHGDVSGDKTLVYVGALVVTYLVGHALEDAAEKFRGKTAIAGALHNLGAVLSEQIPGLMQQLPTILDGIAQARGPAAPVASGLDDMLRNMRTASYPHCPDCKMIIIDPTAKPGDPCEKCGKPLQPGPVPPPEGKA